MFGPLHKNVGLLAAVTVFRVVVAELQVIPVLVMVACGGALLPETVVEEVDVQPLVLLVTIRV